MDKIAIKLVIRNEEDFLDEWFQYYISLGFKNYIIYDDESTDGSNTIINFYKNIVNITVHQIISKNKQHYSHIFVYTQYDYILFIDIDEFLYIAPNINLENMIKTWKDKQISVFQLPRVDVGNPSQYEINNDTCMETIKYSYFNNIQCNNPQWEKCKKNNYTYETKHFFNPKNSVYTSGHTSKPTNNTQIASEFSILQHTGQYYFTDTRKNILDYSMFLIHHDTQTQFIHNKNMNKYRTECIHLNRKNIKHIKKKLSKLTLYKTFHIDYSKSVMLRYYHKYGFYTVRQLFNNIQIQNILNQAQNIYKTQMIQKKLIETIDIDENTFLSNMKILFKEHNNAFLNCGKQCQHLIDLWKLSLDDKITNVLSILGIKQPIISTRPVLFSNSSQISKNSIHHTVPPHQDWASMQGSINSIICWIPLIDINQDLGSIALVPQSHTQGLISKEKVNSFGLVTDYKDTDFSSFDVKQGDAIFFSSFLVHKSGNNITDKIRWSTHFRYNDLSDKTFINNEYPHAYIYKPVDEILIPNFDTKQETQNYFNK